MMLVRADQGFRRWRWTCLAEARGDISGWGKNGAWDSSKTEVSERQMLESGQIGFPSQRPLDELSDCGPIHDLFESLIFYL